jgi:hypothetical protein
MLLSFFSAFLSLRVVSARDKHGLGDGAVGGDCAAEAVLGVLA